MESNWRWEVANQGLTGYTAGPGLPPVKLCARLYEGIGYTDWIVDWRIPNAGWYVRIPDDNSTPYTYGVIFGLSGPFPFGLPVPPDI